MAQKIIFLDVDGTLTDFRDGGDYIPPSAVEAVHRARAKGNLVYLCTGRSLPELHEGITDIGIDGIIGGAGAFVISEGKTLLHRGLEKLEAIRLVEYFGRNRIAYYLETNHGLFISDNYIEYMKQMFPDLPLEGSDFIANMHPAHQCSFEGINKMSFTSTTRTIEEIDSDLGGEYTIVKASFGPEVPGFYSGELSKKGVDKGSAIRFLLDHLGIPVENSYAFGDSMNDLQMFETVGTAIAMGNSKHGVEQYAAYKTTDIDKDGLYNGMAHFELI